MYNFDGLECRLLFLFKTTDWPYTVLYPYPMHIYGQKHTGCPNNPANIKTDGGYTALFYDKLRWSWAELRSPGSVLAV